MTNKNINNIRLGTFVIVSTALLITALYIIGNTRNLFGKTFEMSAEFHNVNGLMAGNNVRFAGIDVGTVKSVKITSDSSIVVVMIVEEKTRRFIKKNALASIGTDGLMGNKLVNINSVIGNADIVEEGDVLQTLQPIEGDEMLRTLSTTNENIKVITENLKTITQKINSSNSLWNLLMDTLVAKNVKTAIVDIKLAGTNTAILTGDLSSIVKGIKNGEGTIGAILTDTIISGKIEQAVVNIDVLSNEIALITGDLKNISEKINAGKGSLGALLMDTTFIHNLNRAVLNINEGAEEFSTIMEGLEHSIFLRRYFKKKGKVKN